jgi:hypothetical protein
MDYIDLDLCSETQIDEIEDIKNNNSLSQYQKIKQVKEYFLSKKNFAYPDFILEWVAREKLGCPFTKEEIEKMKQSSKQKQEIIDKQNFRNELEDLVEKKIKDRETLNF